MTSRLLLLAFLPCGVILRCGLSGGGERRGPAGHIGHDEDESSQERAGDVAGNSDSAHKEHSSWAASGLRQGQRVRVRGLASRPEFNGTIGLIRGQVSAIHVPSCRVSKVFRAQQ